MSTELMEPCAICGTITPAAPWPEAWVLCSTCEEIYQPPEMDDESECRGDDGTRGHDWHKNRDKENGLWWICRQCYANDPVLSEEVSE